MTTLPLPGTICQSCGMPLVAAEDLGTDEQGGPVPDYCGFCVAGGVFRQPAISMQAMIDQCVPLLVERSAMSPAQAKALMTDTLPKLKRWRTAPATGVLVV
jgi:hypothetical protein